MAITLTDAVRNAACNAIVDLVDAGAGAGTLEIKSAASTTAGVNEVATLTFSTTAFGAAGASVQGRADADTITPDTAAAGGTAGFYTVFDSNNLAIWQGTVAASGADLNLSSVTITGGDTVSVSSFTLTVPATA